MVVGGKQLACNGNSNAVACGCFGAIYTDYCDFEAAGPFVRQGQRQVHEGVKLDRVKLAILPGADEGRFVQALQSDSELEQHQKACHKGMTVGKPYMQRLVAKASFLREAAQELLGGHGHMSARHSEHRRQQIAKQKGSPEQLQTSKVTLGMILNLQSLQA